MHEVRFPPRLDVAHLPTPITRLERLPKQWGTGEIWLKRDDDTGGPLTGNKIRKLQYAVREAIDQGADVLVTCGGLQSNHCRATAIVARRFGLDVVLMLRGTQPERLEGNFALDWLMGAEIRWVTPEAYRDKDAGMRTIADELESQGRRPYVIAEGCSMPIGSWGYIEACREIAQFEQREGLRFDAIVAATGSGGTLAGLELGKRLFGLEGDVFGINVCDDEAYFRSLVHRIATETIERFSLDVTLSPEEIGILDGHVGLGYGRPRPEELETLLEVARTEGVVLDPVYTGKAFHGLKHELREGRLKDKQRVLFIHTGGVFGLFGHLEQLALEAAERP